MKIATGPMGYEVGSREITIEITNLTNDYCLFNPKVYLESGETFNPPQPTVRPLKTGVYTFPKTSAEVTGSVGVMTYDLFERSRNDYIETLAVMFSVPWDYNLYKNWFAVGIYPKEKECDQTLYKEMYYQNNPQGFVREEANRSDFNLEGKSLDKRATMCPLGGAIIKLEVWDKLLSPLRTNKPVCHFTKSK
ncbi:DELTA-sagatoxin-Srs1a-like [Carassius auratus]|uniref:DELTA-sagatoxin-Srs1a-like n=1 Tax=Carassius auratus TaxID=7957 RepID=A0A6P6N096_CARAU|nr:DELTA-sagatoxin-Srs1a-like [Carassius auratus]